MNNKDWKKEWFIKAEIDYYAPFIMLWLSCNSWYKFHIDELPNKSRDRKYINYIKENSTKLYGEFKKIFDSDDNNAEKVNFFNYIEQLHYALIRAELKYEINESTISLEHVMLTDDSLTNLVIKDAKTKKGNLKKKYNSAYDLGRLVLIDDIQKIFAGIFEIIYQVRCQLMHGSLKPCKENHEVVKFCYLILFSCLNEFCEQKNRNPPAAAISARKCQASNAWFFSTAVRTLENGLLLSQFSKRYVADFRLGVFWR